MTPERYEKWEAVKGITAPIARVAIEEDDNGLRMTLYFSEMVNGLPSNLHINFGRVPAYAVYDEFVHPWLSHTQFPPRLDGAWDGYSFPLLLVNNSQWQSSFSESQMINWTNSLHYRIVTLDHTVDVLCNTVPEVKWV